MAEVIIIFWVDKYNVNLQPTSKCLQTTTTAIPWNEKFGS